MAFDLEPADEDFLASAPQRYCFPMDLPVLPETVWAALTSDNALSWVHGLSIRWTSARPFGTGTTRVAHGGYGGIRLQEHYFIWDEGRRNAFFVERANVPVFRRFAEDYVIEPTAEGCRFTWTFAVEPRGPRASAAFGHVMQRAMFGRMAQDTRAHFGAR